jgi:hypothetical protein
MQNNISQPELNTYIEEEIVLPNIKEEVEKLIKNKKLWKKTSIIINTLSQISSAIATILTFSGAIFDYKLISFFAGSINILSLLLLLFSKYADTQENRCLEELSKIPIYKRYRNINIY